MLFVWINYHTGNERANERTEEYGKRHVGFAENNTGIFQVMRSFCSNRTVAHCLLLGSNLIFPFSRSHSHSHSLPRSLRLFFNCVPFLVQQYLLLHRSWTNHAHKIELALIEISSSISHSICCSEHCMNISFGQVQTLCEFPKRVVLFPFWIVKVIHLHFCHEHDCYWCFWTHFMIVLNILGIRSH